MMDWRAQEQLEEERLYVTLRALRRCKEAGAADEDLDTLAAELGVRKLWNKETQHAVE